MEGPCCTFPWPFTIFSGSITEFQTFFFSEVLSLSVPHHVFFSLPRLPSLLLLNSREFSNFLAVVG